METWTIRKILGWTASYLKEQGTDSPRLDGELLLSHSLGCERIQLYLDYDKPLSAEERTNFKALLMRRAASEPVAYIIGRKAFRDMELQVNQGVLIPRPDTETVVEAIMSLMESGRLPQKPRIVDLGCGSGCLALSLKKLLPEALVCAWDVSEDALAVSRNNAVMLGIDIVCERRDMLAVENWQNHDWDLVVSNPPYVSRQEMAELSPDVLQYEPHLALSGGEDGLDFYRFLLPRIYRSDRQVVFVCEVGQGQAPLVQDLAAAAGWSLQHVRKDLAGIDRVLVFSSSQPPESQARNPDGSA